jgi:Zn-dependent protease/CBS domain-containing protein
MGATVRLGRIWGVPIGLHWSWFLIFGLITISLAEGYFPEEFPDLSTGALWALGALTSVLFFSSVLLHELGHVRLALRNDVPVRSVTLFLFGGIAQIGREAKSAGAEFRIAVAGPLVSLALAALFGGLWLLDRDIDVLAAPSVWLARINLALALFNLIPGYPLDGGRILRAVVWHLTGSEQRANRIASTAGQVVAIGFISIGVLGILAGDVGGGLWLIFIGWFLQNAVAATRASSALEETLRGVTVQQVMAIDPAVVPPSMSLQQLVDERILSGGGRTFVVAEDSRPVGLVTLKDVTTVPKERWPRQPLADVMVPLSKLVVVQPEAPLLAALQAMDDADVAQVPVARNGAVVGILTRDQVLRYIRTRAELGM